MIESMYKSATRPTSTTYWLEAAQSVIRRECGWHVAPVVEQTFTLDGTGSRTVLIPSGKVVSLLSAVAGGEDVTEGVGVSDAGILEFPVPTPRDLGSVVVTVKHGYDPAEVPEVTELIYSLAERAKTSNSNRMVSSQAAGGMSVTYVKNRDGMLPGTELSRSERDILAPFRIKETS